MTAFAEGVAELTPFKHVGGQVGLGTGVALDQDEPSHGTAQRIVGLASIGANDATGHQGIQTGPADTLAGKGVLGGTVTAGEDAQRPDGFRVEGRHGGAIRNKATDYRTTPSAMVMGRLVHEPTMERANRSNATAPTNAASGSASDIFSVAFVTHGARSDVADCGARASVNPAYRLARKAASGGERSGRCRPIKEQRQAVGDAAIH